MGEELNNKVKEDSKRTGMKEAKAKDSEITL